MHKTQLASVAFGLSTAMILAVSTYTPADIANLAGSTVQAPAPDDATIIAIFDAANTADIETGQLAAKRGHSQEVRDFGAMLARDHTAARKLGRDLAKKLGVTPTPPEGDEGAKKHAATMAMLSARKGPEFDHAFLQYEVAFHKGVIEAVQSTLLPAIDNPELKKLVVEVARAFQAHMLAAQALDDQLSK